MLGEGRAFTGRPAYIADTPIRKATSSFTPHLLCCSNVMSTSFAARSARHSLPSPLSSLSTLFPRHSLPSPLDFARHSGTDLPKGCTPENTCAIASDLAAETYGCEVRHSSIEDDDSNFTRFLLLSRRGVTKTDCEGVKCKTSVVFTLEETPGALYKALACFSLRDVDFSKIESRPTSPGLLSHLKFKGKR